MSRRGRRFRNHSPSIRSIQRKQSGMAWFLIVFGSIFLLVGGFATWFMSLDVWRKQVQSQSWVEVQAVIDESKVTSSRSSDGTSYSPEISFSYEWEGRSYQSTSWRFMSVSSSNRSWAREVVALYAAGSTHPAWVNPNDPAEAVLERELGLDLLLTFIPAVFFVVGLGIAGFGVRTLRKRNAATTVRKGDSLASDELRDAKLLGLPEFPAETGGEVELVPKQTPLGRMMALGLFALFWNGFVGLFLGFLIADGRSDGNYEVVPIAFLSIFAVIGILILIGALYTFLGFLFGPRVRLRASSRILKPGEPWEVKWEFLRGTGRVRHVSITLEGETEGEYTSGGGKNSSRVTDTKVFLRRGVFSSDDVGRFVRGSATVDIPEDIPHSFEAPNNRIRFRVCLNADVSLMPNLREKYEVFVPPTVTEVSPSS